MDGHDRLLRLTLIAVCGAAVTAPIAGAGAGDPGRSGRANLRPLWGAFPLGPRLHTAAGRPAGKTSASPHTVPVGSSSRAGNETWSTERLTIIALAMVLAAAAAALTFRYLLPASRGGRARSARSPPFRSTEGGSSMINRRRKRWAPDVAEPAQPQGQPPETAENPRSAVERVAAYSASTAREGGAEAPVSQVSPDTTKGADEESPADPVAIGEEVGTVLKSAQEAAAKIRRAAQDEAKRVRAEAESAAAAAVAEAGRKAEADRAAAARIRAEAEARAKDSRDEANAFANESRKRAEDEAAAHVRAAQQRLEAADAEAEQRVRRAEAEARERVEGLQSEAARYEERLESMLVVFRGMSSQLEELVGRRRGEPGDAAAKSNEVLEEALHPNRSGSRMP